MKYLTSENVRDAAMVLARRILFVTKNSLDRKIKLYGVPRGGIPVMYLVAECIAKLGGPEVIFIHHESDVGLADFIVDDIIDSGSTCERYAKRFPSIPFYSLMKADGEWVVFPWEATAQTSAEDIPLRLLQFIGEDPRRDGLRDTPRRYIKAMEFLCGGYKQDPSQILGTSFENDGSYDEMVVLRDIEFYSLCEHHILPFFGRVHIAYIPSPTGRIVGISKLARLVECFARRLQIQERLTAQIADAIQKELKPLGVGVLVEAQHLCMTSRGVQKQNSVMQTSALRGKYVEPAVRTEFLQLIGKR